MGNNIKSASDREGTKSLYEEDSEPSIPPSTNYQDDLQSYKSYLSQHQIIDQIQFRSLPDKFCSVRILIMQSGMNGNTLMYDTHHDNNFKQFKAKLNQNTKEVNERFRKIQMLKSTTVANKIKTTSPSLKPLLGVLSQNNLNQSFQSQSNTSSNANNKNNNNKQTVGMNDTSILGEILFGSIPIQILGQNTKIHTLPQHKQTCLSKVFRVGLPISTIIKSEALSDHGDDSSSTHKDIPQNNEANTTPSTNSSPTVGSLVRNRAVSIIQQPNAQVSATAYSPTNLGTRNRSYSTSVTDSIKDNLIDKAATVTTTEDTKASHKKNRRKKLSKDQDISFMCKSSFGIAVLLVFHDCGEDKDELQNPSQLQRLIFSHFPIFEHKLRKLLNSCKNTIQNYLKKKVDEARESDKLDEIFSGFTFNIKSFHGSLQDSEDISNASIDFNKFIISFLHAPRFNEPIWQSQSLVSFEKSNNFSTFLTDLAMLTRKDDMHMGFFSLVLTTILSNHLSWVSQFTEQERNDCDDNPSLLIQKYLKSLYGSGYLPTVSASGDPEKKGLKKFCKIIVVGSNNRDIRYCISMITFLLQSALLLEKEFSFDKPQQSISNIDSKTLPETLITLTPMQFVEMKPPMKTKPKKKSQYENTTTTNRAIHPIESDSDEDSEYHIKPVVLVPKPNFTLAPYDSHVEEMNLKMKFNKFGNSLFADVCTWYCGGFVISGLPRYVNFQKELIEDLDFVQTESIDGDSRLPDIASCIIIDIEGRSCNVVTSKHKTAKFEEGHTSSIISKLLHELLFLRSVDQSEEGEKVCEQIFKDTLYGLVLKVKLMFSIVDSIDSENRPSSTGAIHWRSAAKQTPTKGISVQLKKILVSKPKKSGSERITYEELAHLLHVNITDMPLLMSIAVAFRSDIARKVIPHKLSKKKKR